MPSFSHESELTVFDAYFDRTPLVKQDAHDYASKSSAWISQISTKLPSGNWVS
jgi:hypothetical protein